MDFIYLTMVCDNLCFSKVLKCNFYVDVFMYTFLYKLFFDILFFRHRLLLKIAKTISRNVIIHHYIRIIAIDITASSVAHLLAQRKRKKLCWGWAYSQKKQKDGLETRPERLCTNGFSKWQTQDVFESVITIIDC